MMDRNKTKTGPDKGWCWVIVFAACFANFVLVGILNTGDVLFSSFFDGSDVAHEKALWPLDICVIVLSFSGIFSGILGHKFGVRPIVIAGAIIGSVGMSSCFFASLNNITILFGGVFGFGCGLINTMLPVIVNAYILDLRGLANGIASCGSCIGSITFPVAVNYIVLQFGFSGSFLLIGGIVLNVVVVGSLLRPPNYFLRRKRNLTTLNTYDSSKEFVWKSYEKSRNTVSKRKISNLSIHSSTKQSVNSKSEDHMNVDAKRINSDDPENVHQYLHAELVEALKNRASVQTGVSHAFAAYKDPSSDSLFSTSSSSCVDNKCGQLDPELCRAQKELQDSLNDFENALNSILETSQSEEVLNKFNETESVKTSVLTDSCPARHSFSISSTRRSKNKLSKSEILNSKPLKKCNLKFENSSEDLSPVPKPTHKMLFTNLVDHKITSVTLMDDIEEEDKQEVDSVLVTKEPSLSILQTFQSVLKYPIFYIIALTNIIFYFLYYVYISTIIDYTIVHGMLETDAKSILFVFTVADLFGRLCLGWITDLKIVTRKHFVMYCMIAIGIIFFVFPFASGYWALIAVSFIYGLLFGCTIIMFPILLVDYIGIKFHAISYGCLCFMYGIFHLTRPFVIGYLRDSISSYDNIFYIMGVLSVITSFAWLLEKCFKSQAVLVSDIIDNVNLECVRQNSDKDNV